MWSDELRLVKSNYSIAKARYVFNMSDKDWFKVKEYAETLIELAREGQ